VTVTDCAGILPGCSYLIIALQDSVDRNSIERVFANAMVSGMRF